MNLDGKINDGGERISYGDGCANRQRERDATI